LLLFTNRETKSKTKIIATTWPSLQLVCDGRGACEATPADTGADGTAADGGADVIAGICPLAGETAEAPLEGTATVGVALKAGAAAIEGACPTDDDEAEAEVAGAADEVASVVGALGAKK
jgi:hypothetical protein